MRYFEIINEGRDAPLYHGSGIGAAISILKGNEIWAATQHEESRLNNLGNNINSEPVFGVSLSRNREMAFGFGDVVFMIDQTKLSQRYKIIPFDYWSAGIAHNRYIKTKRSDSVNNLGDRYEYEEFCVGSITPLNRYLMAILMTQKKYSYIENNYSIKDTEILIKHPLLRIIELPKLHFLNHIE